MKEPLQRSEVKRLLREAIANEGRSVVLCDHVRERMIQHNLNELDITNILRGGAPGEGEYENGSWRYRVSTRKMAAVITFDREYTKVIVVTAWRHA